MVSWATTSMNGLTYGTLVLARVDFELDLGVLVNPDAVLELQRLQALRVIVARLEVFARGYGGFLYETVA